MDVSFFHLAVVVRVFFCLAGLLRMLVSRVRSTPASLSHLMVLSGVPTASAFRPAHFPDVISRGRATVVVVYPRHLGTTIRGSCAIAWGEIHRIGIFRHRLLWWQWYRTTTVAIIAYIDAMFW